MKRTLLVSIVFVVGCGAPEDPSEALAEDAEAEVHAVHAALADDLGHVDFQVSCAPAVREDFDRSLALLHHMMYDGALAGFEEIAERDPDCAMAHWGIAMALFQPLWPGRPDADLRHRGWAAVERAREPGPGTDRERALVDAAAAFWQDPDSEEWWPRIERWAEALESAHAERPDDLETAAFHALSLIAVGMARGGEEQLRYNARAAELAASIHEREPLHPGAIHYTIHADDATGRADEHLHVVARYGEIAPDVPHALHMPSHIYVRLGDWPEVIEWNRRSAAAALDHPAGDYVSIHHVHGLDYKLYGYLQRGEDGPARAVLQEALTTEPYREDFVTAFHLAIMPARYAIERRAWEEAAALEPRSPEHLAWDGYPWPEALGWFASGLGAVMTGDLAGARQAEARMKELAEGARESGEGAFATYIEVDGLILAGRIAWAEGDADAAIRKSREAAELEGEIEKHPVTPGALLPAHEALGDLLLDMDRPAEALAAYEAGLEVWPKRYRSLLGAARAAGLAGHDQRAEAHYATLLAVVDESADRRGIEEARDALGND